MKRRSNKATLKKETTMTKEVKIEHRQDGWIAVSVAYGNGYKESWPAKSMEEVARDIVQADINAELFEHKRCFLAPCEKCIKKAEMAINSEKFAYVRISKELGVYRAKIYMKDDESPTGVISGGGVPLVEWEKIAIKNGKANQYLAPIEKW